eukprot:scaffold230105_cov30-Tisochrysis_lutea.AAC.2
MTAFLPCCCGSEDACAPHHHVNSVARAETASNDLSVSSKSSYEHAHHPSAPAGMARRMKAPCPWGA